MLFLLKKHISSLMFSAIGIIFLLFLAKNPYSDRNLIANLEPFPDAQYYTTTPRCFLSGQSWKMCRLFDPSIKGIKTVIPPAYSITLLPAYVINFDVRTFYFVNVVLAMISLFLLYKICDNFFKNGIITGVILLFYITNYYIYWYPSLAMAENLFLPIFLASILLLQTNISKKNSFLAGLITAGFYATKYAYAPLTMVFPIIYLVKLICSKNTRKSKVGNIALLSLPAASILASLVGIEQLLGVLNEVSNGAVKTESSSRITSGGGYFSINYFSEHFKAYSDSLLGKSQRFLWEFTPLVEKWIALPGLWGLLVAFKNSKLNYAKFYLIISVMAQLLFISTFYVVDIRYVYHFLPVLLLGFGFFLKLLSETILKNKKLFISFVTMILIIYLGSNAMRLKSVIMVNLKYAETPWWYLSQLKMNDYFNTIDTVEKPFLITLASPFLSDNYSNQNYSLLPLDAQQDFKGNMPEVWGSNNYQNLLDIYEEMLVQGNRVYITNYGVSAASHFKQSYKDIEERFTLNQVNSGCYDLCNIYKLELK